MHWTYSRLADYEKCPALYDARYRARWPDFIPAPKLAANRGEKLHGLMEQATASGIALTGALKPWNAYVTDLRRAWPLISVEQPIALDRGWRQIGYKSKSMWWRGKLDVECLDGQGRGKVVDWKSGQIYGSNADQVRLYAGVMFQIHPDLQETEVELVYLDERKGISETIARAAWPEAQEDFERRVSAMLTAKTFPPKPASHCSYCEFGPAKGGPCTAGISNRAGLQTSSTKPRVEVVQIAPLRGRHARQDFSHPEAPSSIRGVKTSRRRKA